MEGIRQENSWNILFLAQLMTLNTFSTVPYIINLFFFSRKEIYNVKIYMHQNRNSKTATNLSSISNGPNEEKKFTTNPFLY